MTNGRGNDIALLKLAHPALLSHTVGLACLPNGNLMDRVTPGTKCFLTGKNSWSFSLIIIFFFLYFYKTHCSENDKLFTYEKQTVLSLSPPPPIQTFFA